MISRSTLIGALVVVELAIIGMAAQAVSGSSSPVSWTLGPRGWSHRSAGVTARLDKTFETGGAPHVVVDVDNADVTIQTGAATSVHVAGTMSVSHYFGGVKPSLDAIRTSDGVRVAVESGLARANVEREVRITVPPDAQVEIASAGSVSTSGLHGKLTARLTDGDIKVTNHRGDVDVATASGDIVMLDAQGTRFALHTEDGALKLTSSGADHVDALTHSGSIQAVDFRAVDGALKTNDGGIDVGFASESDASVSLHTDDGHISGTGQTPPDGDSASRSLQLGSGRGHFEISTGDGSITITPGANSHA